MKKNQHYYNRNGIQTAQFTKRNEMQHEIKLKKRRMECRRFLVAYLSSRRKARQKTTWHENVNSSRMAIHTSTQYV